MGVHTSHASNQAAPLGRPCEDCPVVDSALCNKLNPGTCKDFKSGAAPLSFGKNEMILSSGSAQARLLILTEGVARLARSFCGGNRQVLSFFFPGDIMSFGDRRQAWAADLEAVSTCGVCCLESDQVQALRLGCPSFDRHLLAAAQEQIARHQSHILDLGRTSAIQRLTIFLLTLETRVPVHDGGDGCFAIPMGRAEIADYLILQVETVSRCFARLVALRAIDLPKPTMIRLRDRRLLDEMAEGSMA